MAQGTLALLMLVVASGLLVSVGKFGNSTVKAIAVRLAAISYVAAGINVAGGWLGDGIAWLVQTADDIGSAVVNQAFGTGAVWVLYLALVVTWVAGMVPEKWFNFPIPDWLAVSGLILPAMTEGLPGDLGQGLHRLVMTTGNTMTEIVTTGVS